MTDCKRDINQPVCDVVQELQMKLEDAVANRRTLMTQRDEAREIARRLRNRQIEKSQRLKDLPWEKPKDAEDKVRALHLMWNGEEWIDERCGCRYHPDDPNMTHGGAPHMHPCKKHAKQDSISFDREGGPLAPRD